MHVFTTSDIKEAFDQGIPIYFDTMVFRNLWKLHSSPRKSLLASIEGLGARTYLPYQVQVELHRQAYSDSVLNNVPTPGLFQSRGTLESVMQMVLAEVDKVRPQSGGSGGSGVASEHIEDFRLDIQARFKDLFEWHDQVDEKLRNWFGEQVNVTAIRRGHEKHQLLEEIAEVFAEGHMLPPTSHASLEEWRQLYWQRVNQDDPVGPGKTDRNKASVDEAAGDYYVWKEMLAHCVAQGSQNGFVFVTEEKKADLWEVLQGDKTLRRIDPRIQAESIEATGGPMYVLSFDEFLEHAVTDSETREILSSISQDASSLVRTWSETAYVELLELLIERGYRRQHDVIVNAARENGSLTRSRIGEILGWGGDNRYLTRFRVPADRAKKAIVGRGLVSQDALDPLWAVYSGPGEATAYAVPDEFAEFQLALDGGSDVGSAESQ